MSRRQRAFQRLAAVNPVTDRSPTRADQISSEMVMQRILSEPVTSSNARPFLTPRRRLIAIALAIAALVAPPSYAIGRTVVAWVLGDPAPAEVVTDFGKHTPQLGFNPDPGEAVLVARDADLRLYVTTNRQGTYCFIVNTRLDGGSCVNHAVAAAPVVAGFAGSPPPDPGKSSRLVVVGRIQRGRPARVSFTTPDRDRVTTSIGLGGFFVAGVPVAGLMDACAHGDWSPTFEFLSADRELITAATIKIADSPRQGVWFLRFTARAVSTGARAGA
jgi:hypothetical protein